MAAPRGGLDRMELERAVDSGATIAELAELFNRSKATVRYWLRRYGVSTRNRVGPRGDGPRPFESDAGLGGQRRMCSRHGVTEFVLEGRGVYRCKQCRMEAVVRRRRRVKAILVEEAGGKCVVCGYDRNQKALEFHHLDPSMKRLAVSARGAALAIETLRAEATKCVLLCSNCHVEVEDGQVAIPATVVPSAARSSSR